jgi:hypothetical protein
MVHLIELASLHRRIQLVVVAKRLRSVLREEERLPVVALLLKDLFIVLVELRRHLRVRMVEPAGNVGRSTVLVPVGFEEDLLVLVGISNGVREERIIEVVVLQVPFSMRMRSPGCLIQKAVRSQGVLERSGDAHGLVFVAG